MGIEFKNAKTAWCDQDRFGEETMKQVSTGFIEKTTAAAVHRGYKALHPDRDYVVITNEVGTYDVMQIESTDLAGYDEIAHVFP